MIDYDKGGNAKAVLEVLKGYGDGEGLSGESIAEMTHLSVEEVESALTALMNEGEVYEPHTGTYKVQPEPKTEEGDGGEESTRCRVTGATLSCATCRAGEKRATMKGDVIVCRPLDALESIATNLTIIAGRGDNA